MFLNINWFSLFFLDLNIILELLIDINNDMHHCFAMLFVL